MCARSTALSPTQPRACFAERSDASRESPPAGRSATLDGESNLPATRSLPAFVAHPISGPNRDGTRLAPRLATPCRNGMQPRGICRPTKVVGLIGKSRLCRWNKTFAKPSASDRSRSGAPTIGKAPSSLRLVGDSEPAHYDSGLCGQFGVSAQKSLGRDTV